MSQADTDPEKTAAAVTSYLASLPEDQANAIRALPPDKQLSALVSQADQDIASPWPSHNELTGQRNPLEVINWQADVYQSSSSQAALPEAKPSLTPTA